MVVCSAAVARAQVPAEPDVSKLRKLGPLYFNPTLALTNAGVDTNVFNEPDDAVPKKDFTLTVSPKSAMWMRFGRTWLNANITEDIVWYKKYASERSSNADYKVSLLVPLTRIAFIIGGDKVATRERPGFEIDTRSRRSELAANGAIELRALTKTFFGLRAERRHLQFDKAEVFLGTNLHDALTRTMTSEALTIRNELTPLTNVVIDFGREQDRFDYDPLRDSDSTQVNVGIKFDQLALIKGGMQVGFRDFSPVVKTVAGFKGLTTAVDLSYVFLGSTRVQVGASRDVQYSFDVNQPYYVQTGVTASLTQQIFGPLDLQGRIAAARLAYRTREDVTVVDPNRVDHTRTYGVGVGYHMGANLRLGFNLDWNKRESVVTNRTYHGLKYGTAITYGF
jgi:hypothetical protein